MFALQYYRYVEIAIKQCKSSGIDCKVWGISIVGKRRNGDECSNTIFSFLADDGEEAESAVDLREDRLHRDSVFKKNKIPNSFNTETRVFVWGLNDKDQLGGPRGSKVRL